MSTPTPGKNQNSGTNSTANVASNQTNSTSTVIVYCKLPNGFLMELGERGESSYQAIGLKGINHMQVKGATYGVTEGVPEAFFNEWVKKVAKFKIIKNGLIFKAANLADGKAMAAELKGQVTGLEPLNTKKLPKNMADVQAKVEKLTKE